MIDPFCGIMKRSYLGTAACGQQKDSDSHVSVSSRGIECPSPPIEVSQDICLQQGRLRHECETRQGVSAAALPI